MKNLLFVVLCLVGFTISAQNYLGFSPQNCIQPMTNVYAYSNYSNGTGSGYSAGFSVAKNGVGIYGEYGQLGNSSHCLGIVFVNDSTGFVMAQTGGGAVRVLKTNNYGSTWNLIGTGYPGYLGLYVVNVNVAYLITGYVGIMVTRCSDIMPPYNVINDNNVNADIYIKDTTFNNTLCNIDSLNINFINANWDAFTYHINSHIPLVCTPASTTICVGSSINVPFETGGNFNSGNVFTAELSDAFGSFSSPVNIGSLNSTLTGTINAVIPPFIPAGSNYKIRVVSSNPYYIGASNGAKIDIGNGLPSIGIINSYTDSVTCIGSVVNLYASSSAASYTWSTGATLAGINVTVTTTSTYSVQAENVCGISTATTQVVVDTTCSYVKPGDVNSDGVVNNLDVLELGLHFSQTGPPRPVMGNNWQSYYAPLWGNTITNGKNLNNSDCNGDGIINHTDTLAIFNNYNNINISSWTYTNLDLIIVPDQPSILIDSWSSASIYLGDSTNVISNINGLAFSVEFMNSIDSIYLEYSTSFLNNSNQNLNFSKIYPAPSGVVYAATTHTNNIDVSGYGKIATLHFRTTSTQMSPNQSITFWLDEVYKSNSAGVLTRLKGGARSVWVTDFVGIEEINSSVFISLIPNPANEFLTLNSNKVIQKIEVSNIAGQKLLLENISDKSHKLQLQNFAEGIYFVKVVYENGQNITKKVIVSR